MCVQRFWRKAAQSTQSFWSVRWRQWETNSGVLSTVTGCSSTSAHCSQTLRQVFLSDMKVMQNKHKHRDWSLYHDGLFYLNCPTIKSGCETLYVNIDSVIFQIRTFFIFNLTFSLFYTMSRLQFLKLHIYIFCVSCILCVVVEMFGFNEKKSLDCSCVSF